jgi:hypothetical protein
MIEDGVPSVNPKLDAICEMLKTIHDLNEKNKMLVQQIKEIKGIILCTCEGCSRLPKLYKAFEEIENVR